MKCILLLSIDFLVDLIINVYTAVGFCEYSFVPKKILEWFVMEENIINALNSSLTAPHHQDDNRIANNWSAHSYKAVQGSWCQRRYCNNFDCQLIWNSVCTTFLILNVFPDMLILRFSYTTVSYHSYLYGFKSNFWTTL